VEPRLHLSSRASIVCSRTRPSQLFSKYITERCRRTYSYPRARGDAPLQDSICPVHHDERMHIVVLDEEELNLVPILVVCAAAFELIRIIDWRLT
jgi:hypothetical protein